MSGFINGINSMNSLFAYSSNFAQSINANADTLLDFDAFGVDVNNTDELMDFASQYSSATASEARVMLENQGLMINGLDTVSSLRSITRSGLNLANDLLDRVKTANPDLPDYGTSNFTLSDDYKLSIANAMDYKRYVEQRLADDPNWEGDPTATAQRETRMMQLTEQQTAAMNNLNANIGVLASNTANLPQMLNNLVDSSNNTGTVMGNLFGVVSNIQQWLVNFEEQMALNAEAEEEAAAQALEDQATAIADALVAAQAAAAEQQAAPG